jgi:hypothetical protein
MIVQQCLDGCSGTTQNRVVPNRLLLLLLLLATILAAIREWNEHIMVRVENNDDEDTGEEDGRKVNFSG